MVDADAVVHLIVFAVVKALATAFVGAFVSFQLGFALTKQCLILVALSKKF